ncbi:MAG: hypothetical protein KJP21_02000 [Bacteroidia bacterium]|nr:hypothetical protein [Bacteroidia bacterium]NNJ54839.1 hypothetical protein [Bacteroidia bacterium]
MWILSLILVLLVPQSDISDYRKAYESQDEAAILKHLDQLESKKKLTNDEECYYGAFLCLKAKFSNNPYTKYSSFTKGYKKLNSLITKESNVLEYRYHRFMVETKAPSFLIENSHIEEDKAFILKNLKSSHPLFILINKTID